MRTCLSTVKFPLIDCIRIHMFNGNLSTWCPNVIVVQVFSFKYLYFQLTKAHIRILWKLITHSPFSPLTFQEIMEEVRKASKKDEIREILGEDRISCSLKRIVRNTCSYLRLDTPHRFIGYDKKFFDILGMLTFSSPRTSLLIVIIKKLKKWKIVILCPGLTAYCWEFKSFTENRKE